MSLKYPNPAIRNASSTNQIGGVNAIIDDLRPIIDAVNSQDNRISSLESGGSAFTELEIQGDATIGYGLLSIKNVSASVAFSGGASETVPIQLPANVQLIGFSIRNDTILVGAGATSYTFDLSSASSSIPTAPTNFTKNTKYNGFSSYITTGVEDLVLTPDAGTLDTGSVTAVFYYYELTGLTDAP